jgi:hypothetical protein
VVKLHPNNGVRYVDVKWIEQRLISILPRVSPEPVVENSMFRENVSHWCISAV